MQGNENNGTESRTRAKLQKPQRQKKLWLKLYSNTVSQKQQLNMSHTPPGLSSREIALQSGSSIPEKRKHEFDELTYPTFRPTFSQQSKQAAQQPLSLFSGAVISGGQISLAINTLNQSPTLSVQEKGPSKTYKRIKPLDSDSD